MLPRLAIPQGPALSFTRRFEDPGYDPTEGMRRSQQKTAVEIPQGASEPVAPGEAVATVLWTTTGGIRCVMRPYDETRYQIRLLRNNGTIKSDVASGHLEAMAIAQKWRQEFESGPSSNSKPFT